MSGLYIHIPFCQRKCIYCDFYSVDNETGIFRFLDMLIKEISLRRQKSEINKRFSTIFIGGGTPSLLTGSQMDTVMTALRSHFDIEQECEITVEVNPGTLNKDKLDAYKQIGINRISIGVQSFFNDELSFLSRLHTSDDAVESFKMARNAGYENINIDLMFSIPGQTTEKWEKTLRKTIALSPDHISAYNLTFEKGTPLYKMMNNKEIIPIEDESDAELYGITVDILSNAGYVQYEVSNYARNGMECRHNLNYWACGEYIGLGPSAHSFYRGKRFWNIRNLEKYINTLQMEKIPVAGEEILSRKDRISEVIFLGVRANGIDLSKLKRHFNYDILTDRREVIKNFIKQNYIIIDKDRLTITSNGKIHADLIASDLMITV